MERLACTQKEASEMLGVSLSTIGRYIKNDILKSTKLGARTLVNVNSIYDLMDEDEPVTVDLKGEYHKFFSKMTLQERMEELNVLTNLGKEDKHK